MDADDQIIEMLAEEFNRFVLDCNLKQSSLLDSVQSPKIVARDFGNDNAPALVNKNSDCMDDSSPSNGIYDISPDQGHTLPILKKILDLSNKIQDLKKQHVDLSDNMKVTIDSFPGPDILKSVQFISAEHELLKRKYLEESSERRRLYNEVIELKGNIRVFCRCRPLNENEILNQSASVVNFESSFDNELQVICSDSSKKQFKFDHVFRPEDNQEAVFAQTCPIVTSVLDGYNVCIFAYGQTGTGKTFTMEGTAEHRGVNYRTLEELFRISEERRGVMKYELLVSMLEVYNEKIRDLLADSSTQLTKKLEIKQAADGTQEVPGLVEARVYETKDVWEMLKSGNRVRSVGSTSANELSSRSHCLLRVSVVGENLINGQRTKSNLWLVDLAGSERVAKTEVEGERLKESQFINKSLAALGDVISALASKSAHIPYRNSKLTHILQSSLGGDCKTLMFVQISPSAADQVETLCSLNFATRVRGIESGPARKQADLTELFKYKQMAEKLKHDEKETKKLQDSLQTLQLRLAAREHICRNLQEKVRDLENQIAEERKTRLKQESRSLAAASGQPSTLSSLKQAAPQKAVTEKKPPLGPSKLRLPLRKITNFMPQTSPLPSKKRVNTTSMVPSANGKENIGRTTTMTRRRASVSVRPSAPTTSQVFQPRRRVSIATFRPDTNSDMTTPGRASSAMQVFQPRRRVSIATFHPDTNSDMTTPVRASSTMQVFQPRRRVSIATVRPDTNSDMTTPFRASASRFNGGIITGGAQQSLIRNQRKARYSRLFAPLPEMRSSSETTPIAMRSSSKFMGSPTQADSRVARHPPLVALQRKSLVWSPLKLRGLKNNRRSLLLPSRPSTGMQ